MMGFIKAAHYLTLFISVTVALLAVLLRKCFKKSVKISFAGLLFFCLAVYLTFLRNDCQNWKNGINGQI